MKKAPDIFRFEATRIICRLKKQSSIESKIYNYLFEIQIRSFFEHAWCMAIHDLVYKNEEIDWKKLRLAAHLKAAIEQLDLFKVQFLYLNLKNHFC